MGGAVSTTKACFTGGGGLADAVLDGDDQVVKSVLTNNPKLAGATLSLRDGSTAAHLAATEGRLDYLKLLVETFEASRLEKGRKCKPKHISRMLNRRNMHGQTALMLACKFGHADAVSWLLQQGANPMLFDSIHSRVCLHYAALYGQSDCIHALFADDAYVSMSAGPALLRNAHVLDSQGFHKFIDVRAAMGFAAIHMAASQGHWQAVVALLKHGASLTVRCYGVLRADFAVPARWKPNSTPLHIAAARGSTTMVKHMLQAYAEQVAREPATPDVRLMRDFGDMRPVDIARAYGYMRIAALLDPGRPVELLAYITAGGHMRLGPPSLSALAACALRGRLLHQLAAIEPRLASARASRASSAAGFGSKVSSTAGPAAGGAPAAGGQTAAQRQHGGRNRFVDDFGCAPGCSHAHCGRRVPESQAEPGSAATAAQQGHPGAAAGQSPAPAEAAAEPPDQPAPSPPGFVRIVGLSSPAGGSPGRGILRNGSNRDRSGFRSTSGRSLISTSGHTVSQRSGNGSVHGAAAATTDSAQPQPASLLPAPSAATPGTATAADPFAASGFVADLPVSAALQPQPQTVSFEAAAAPAASSSQPSAGFSQLNMSAFASASFSPFQDERDIEGEVSSPPPGLQGLRQNSIISMSIRPLPSRDLTSDGAAAASATAAAAAAAANANGNSPGSNAGSSCTPAGYAADADGSGVAASPGSATGLPPVALQGRRASAERRWSVDRRRSRSIALPRAASRRPPSARSLATGLEHGESTPMGTPPQARRASFFRDAVSALATRTTSGMIRRNNSEMVLDARLGDVYTGGNGGPSPAAEQAAAPPGATSAAASGATAVAGAQRSSFDSDAAVQAELQQGDAGEGEDVVVAELTGTDRRTSIQFLVRRASTGLARAPSAASLAGDECDICFDAPLEVAIRGCGHQFCAPCLRGVCEATPDKTPRCPFCRRVMDGVVPAAARPGLLACGSAAPVANKAPPAMALDDICNAAIAAQG